MSLPWFRLYHRIIDDEKMRLLAFEDRWHFVAICCLKADGLLDEERGPLWERKVAVKLGVQLRELDEISRRLGDVGLIDGHLNPTAWEDLQYKSDNSTARVQAYRKRQQKQSRNGVKRSRNVTVTAQDTDTDTDTDTEVMDKPSHTRKRASRIADDWRPSVPYPAKVRALIGQWPAERIEREIDGFKDYWENRSRDAARVDWDKVWHNRIRDVHDRVMRSTPTNSNTRGTSMAELADRARQNFHGN